MEEKKFPEGLVPIIEQVRMLEKNKPNDARKKEYKEAERHLDYQTKAARVIIVTEAIKTMKTFGYDFDYKDASDGKIGMLKYPDGFTVYIIPSFRVGYRDDDVSVYWSLYDSPNTGRFSSAWIGSYDKDFDLTVQRIIEKNHKHFVEVNRVSKINEEHAMSFGQKVENDWTSRTGDWFYQRENRPWAGEKVEMEYEQVGEDRDWSNNTRLEVEFYHEKFVTHFDVRVEFKTEEEALAFWNKAKELIVSIGYVKKERRE